MKSIPAFVLLVALILAPGITAAATSPPATVAEGGKLLTLVCTSVVQPFDDGSGKSSCDDACAAQGAACVAAEDWVMPARCSTPGSKQKPGDDLPKVKCRCCRVAP